MKLSDLLTQEEIADWRTYDAETPGFVIANPDDPDYFGLPLHLALMVKEQHDQLEEALSIIVELLPLTNLYARDSQMSSILDRIAVLRLKQ